MSENETKISTPRVRLMVTAAKYERAARYLSPYFDALQAAFIVGGVSYKAKRREEGKEVEWYSDAEVDPRTPFRITDSDGIRFTYGDTFDRNTPRGKFLIQLLLDSKMCAPNKAKINPEQHIFYLKDEEAEAVTEISQAELLLEALQLLKEKTPKEKQEFCYFMGQPAGTMTQTMIDAYCYQTATKNPKLVLDTFQTKGWTSKAYINQFVQHGLVSLTGTTYRIGQEVIGVDLDQAVAWMHNKRNHDQVRQMVLKLKTLTGEDGMKTEEGLAA